MTTRCMSARSRSGQERILEAYHHLLYQALGLPRLLSLVDSWRSPPIRDRDQDGGGATGGPTISRTKAVGTDTALIVIEIPITNISASILYCLHNWVCFQRQLAVVVGKNNVGSN